jgi:beta-lactamase superfamily II metal-dependent hydrolase
MRCSIYADFWQYSFNASLYSDEGLSITILSPPMHWIAEFDEWWMMEMTKAGIANDDLSNAMKQHHSKIEDFASDQIELVPSPIKINRFPIPPSYQGDESPANLASLVLMIERGGRRMLLPSDGRQDQILDALARAGYSDKEGNLWVDLLVLPHSGSKRNVSLEFFRRVKANNYFDLNEWCEIQASS